jgi:ABC-type multidrug transport system fused ATPase/permease subunit
MLVLPFMILTGASQNIVLVKIDKKNGDAYVKGGANAEQALSSIKVVKAYGQESHELQKFKNHIGADEKELKRSSYLYGLTQGLFGSMILFSRAYTFVVATALVLNNVSLFDL